MLPQHQSSSTVRTSPLLSHLDHLEAEAIHIIREVAVTCEKPVMLYSIGKDSTVLLHLARKAFAPGKIPFPLLHVDTTWKFKEMIEYRDRLADDPNVDLLVHVNEEARAQGIGPFTHGSSLHTHLYKTVGLRQALEQHGFNAAIGGARRDEEKSRAKERIFSFRNASQGWDPKNQRPEMWSIYNTRVNPKESVRVFPMSNWTELDVWHYILREKLELVSLYMAAERPVIEHDGMLMMADDEARLPEGAKPEMRMVRFRTLGCWPLTGAVESDAQSLEDIIGEMMVSRTSERQGRVIDKDEAGSMEKKKQEGYF
ncbi:MAG: sulfate adenylyltransferase subunit CysD [Pseudomonadota bacterium]